MDATRRRRITLIALILVLILGFFAYRIWNRPRGEKERIHRMIQYVVAEFEARSPSGVTDYLTEDFQDMRGNSRRDLKRYLAGWFFRNRKGVHIFIVGERIDLGEKKETADVNLKVVAVSGTEAASLDLLPNDARFYIVNLKVKKNYGDWLIEKADYKEARSLKALQGK